MPKTKSKVATFKVGDYIVAEDTTYIEVVAVLAEPGAMPVYGLRKPKQPQKIEWDSEYELTVEQDFKVAVPDFEQFENVVVGDTIVIKGSKTQYVRVLARVGNVCLLSDVPDKDKAEKISKLAQQLEELSEGEVKLLDKDDKANLQRFGSQTRAVKVAADWYHVDKLALMNWSILREE